MLSVLSLLSSSIVVIVQIGWTLISKILEFHKKLQSVQNFQTHTNSIKKILAELSVLLYIYLYIYYIWCLLLEKATGSSLSCICLLLS